MRPLTAGRSGTVSLPLMIEWPRMHGIAANDALILVHSWVDEWSNGIPAAQRMIVAPAVDGRPVTLDAMRRQQDSSSLSSNVTGKGLRS